MKLGVSGTPPPSDPLDVFLDLLADRIAEKLAARARAKTEIPEWATAARNPMGTRHGFLAAARRGEFESGKVGKEIRAKWADVAEYVARRTREAKAPRPAPAPQDPTSRRRAKLAEAGILRKAG